MKEYKKINCDHIVMKQITKDKDIINFGSIIPPSMLAFRFLMKCQDIITIEDSKGVTEKTTENIENLEEFVNWIDNK